MKVRVARAHKARPADYESVDLHASIEIDTEVDTEFANADWSAISEALEEGLDDLLDKPVKRALSLGGNTIDESHLWGYYKID